MKTTDVNYYLTDTSAAIEKAQKIVIELADSNLETPEIIFCVEMINEMIQQWLKDSHISYKLQKVKIK